MLLELCLTLVRSSPRVPDPVESTLRVSLRNGQILRLLVPEAVFMFTMFVLRSPACWYRSMVLRPKLVSIMSHYAHNYVHSHRTECNVSEIYGR